MLYLIFSDVHGNLEAYKRMLKAGEKIKPDAFICLGDIVGYGPNPNETIDRTKKLKNLFIVRGNHDKVAAGLDSTETFNPVARKAIIWTKKKLKDKSKEYPKSLPKGPLFEIANQITKDYVGNAINFRLVIESNFQNLGAAKLSKNECQLGANSFLSVQDNKLKSNPTKLSFKG